jgi:L-2-hydroxyglutarate oxidase LhgO
VPYKKIGKLFVAIDDDDVSKLELTENNGLSNGVKDLTFLDKKQLSKLEPEILAKAALLSPSTGIFDSHIFMESLLSLSEQNGAIFSPNSLFIGAEPKNNGWKVYIEGKNKEKFAISGKVVINSAGLHATEIAKNIFPTRPIPELNPTKGCYLKYTGKSPVRHIIYPAITPGRVEPRVDATPDLRGSLRFGPNVEIPESLDDFKLNKSLVFEMKSGIKRYLPSINEEMLYPDFAGIRPKISIPGQDNADFQFDWNIDHNWLDLFGIESPGLTSSLAISEYVFKAIKTSRVI